MRLVWWSTHSAKLGSPKYLGQHVKKDSGLFMEGKTYISTYMVVSKPYMLKKKWLHD